MKKLAVISPVLQRGSRDRGIVSAYERGLGKVAEPYGDYLYK